ncbi:MAG TPA: hypothetical protein V6D50_14100 [Chroococcales cyanobacterium]
MTPQAIRIVSQLRHEFYSLFSAAMEMPVSITNGSASTGNPPMAFWIDDRQRLNYLRVYVYTAPDELLPKRPFILRVSVNKGGGILTTARWRRDCQGLNQDWHFELTLVPEEILDFLPWLVNLVKSYNQGRTSFVQEPPHPFHFNISNCLSLQEAWTQKACQEKESPNNELATISNPSFWQALSCHEPTA